ncbi:hypothetical protein Tco_0646618 [Tanacetum coccineum]
MTPQPPDLTTTLTGLHLDIEKLSRLYRCLDQLKDRKISTPLFSTSTAPTLDLVFPVFQSAKASTTQLLYVEETSLHTCIKFEGQIALTGRAPTIMIQQPPPLSQFEAPSDPYQPESMPQAWTCCPYRLSLRLRRKHTIISRYYAPKDNHNPSILTGRAPTSVIQQPPPLSHSFLYLQASHLLKHMDSFPTWELLPM